MKKNLAAEAEISDVGDGEQNDATVTSVKSEMKSQQGPTSGGEIASDARTFGTIGAVYNRKVNDIKFQTAYSGLGFVPGCEPGGNGASDRACPVCGDTRWVIISSSEMAKLVPRFDKWMIWRREEYMCGQDREKCILAWTVFHADEDILGYDGGAYA